MESEGEDEDKPSFARAPPLGSKKRPRLEIRQGAALKPAGERIPAHPESTAPVTLREPSPKVSIIQTTSHRTYALTFIFSQASLIPVVLPGLTSTHMSHSAPSPPISAPSLNSSPQQEPSSSVPQCPLDFPGPESGGAPRLGIQPLLAEEAPASIDIDSGGEPAGAPPSPTPSSPFLDYMDPPEDVPPLALALQVANDRDEAEEPDPPLDAANAHHHEDGPPADIPPTAYAIITAATDTWIWRPIMLLCASIHLHYFVSHRAIAAILAALRILFLSAGLITPKSDTPVTLKTIFRRLDLCDKFIIAPMCPTCSRVYPAGSDPSTHCTHCNVPLFTGSHAVLAHESDEHVFQWSTASTASQAPKPVLQTPMRLPSTMLSDLINRLPEMEYSLDKWRHLPPDPLRLRNVQDGEIWRTIEGPDKKPFFDNSPDRSNADELRLGVTLGFDGYVFILS